MAKTLWSELPKRLEVLVRDGKTIDQPSSAEFDTALDEYEVRTGFRLPSSYREFVHWFGPGALSVWFLICAPIPLRLRKRVANVYDIDKQREMLHKPDGYWSSSVSPEVLRRLVLFASTEGGDWFFWDTADVRNAAQHEYGIYGHAHQNNGGEVELVATDFKAFVTEIGLGNLYPFSSEQRVPGWNYWPAWPCKNRKGGKT